jgi:hypothetical protein
MGYGRPSILSRLRPAAAFATASGLVLLGLAPGTASAATAPPTQTAPPAGSRTTVSWTGSIPGATTPNANCPANALSDITDVTISVPAGLYDSATTRADFSISWSDPAGFNDEVLTVVPPTGGGATKTADATNKTSNQHEDVFYDNPAAGVWKVRACAFASTPQAYTGTLVLTSTAATSGSPSPSPEPSPTESSTGGPASDRTFDEPVIVDTDDLNSVSEPSIEIAPDGAIYVTGPQGAGPRVPAVVPGTQAAPGIGGDLIWRSDDAGKTFTFLGSYDGAMGGGDADVVAAPNGKLYGSGLNLACIAVSSSSDRGESWATNPAACEDGAGLADRQWNDVDGNAAVYTGYGTLSRGLVIHKSLIDAPVVVNGPATVVDNNNGDYQWPGVVDVNTTNGNAVMAWNTVDDQIQINGVTRAGALMFASPKRVALAGGDTFDSFVGIDHGTDGTLYAVWSERHNAVRETWTMLAASRDGGTTWDTPVRVDRTPRTTVFPWVTAGDAGRVAVTYLGTDSTGPSAENLDVKDAGWHVWSSFSTDYGQSFAEHRTTVTPLHQGSICTSGTGCAAGTRDLADFIETDLDARGCLVTAYTDNSRDTVSANGTRSPDEATRVAVVRQSGGDGLLASKPCGVPPTPVVPEAPLTALLPLLAAVLVGVIVHRRRQVARA